MQRKSFVFYRSFFEGVMCLPKNRRLPFLEAICRYGLDGEEPELAGADLAFFKQVQAVLDDNNERFENGKKGGRPKRKKPVVSEKKTSGFESENHHIYDEDVDEDEDVDVDGEVSSGKPDPLSPVDELILYLNKTAGRSYQRTETNRNLAAALLDNYSPELIKLVIDNKVAMWKDDPKMAVYLRPKTLFDLSNFENYINEPNVTGDPE